MVERYEHSAYGEPWIYAGGQRERSPHGKPGTVTGFHVVGKEE